MKTRRFLLAVAIIGLGAGLLAGCRTVSLVVRPTTPLVLTGADLTSLQGAPVGRVVAFRHTEDGDGTNRRWTQIPVQVDQRKLVDFGQAPGTNTAPGTAGTVYGNGSSGVTALQYADPNTWVGADTDPTLDANDEVVFMVSDAGGSLASDENTEPVGVVHDSGVKVRVVDPRAPDNDGWVYLFRSNGTLDPAAGQDYVTYDFNLSSGNYKTTYKRADGPNPETSRVTTAAYRIGFSDRWIEDSWRVQAPGASGVDILDGHKNQFAIDFCGRSNVTFADAEGAFVANIDGPVRAIRSYVGANSGPLTERTHLMYRDRVDVLTNLRVHPIPAVLDFIDYSSAAVGMTYRSSTVRGGVAIDGNGDDVPTAKADWEAVDGPQGKVFTRSTVSTDAPGVEAGVEWFYRDQMAPPEQQCWGDGSFFGASGANVKVAIPNTDPRNGAASTFTSRRTTEFARPAADPSKVSADAGTWASNLATPLATTVTPYQP